jgi:23S rRNA G2445 N2-methylase RlmL
MIKAAEKKTDVNFMRYIKHGLKFRVRFQQNGRFIQVPASDLITAESIVVSKTELALDRACSAVEFWYIKRVDGSGIYALLNHKRANADRRLQPGELRPELARLICLFGGVKRGDAVLDPFAGYGSIVEQAAALNGNARVFACDFDQRMVDYIRRRTRYLNARADIRRADARSLGFIRDGSIDYIITDPPWAEYDKEIGDVETLYRACFEECSRVLRTSGAFTLITSKKAEAERAARAAGFILNKKQNILVNGKKAEVYKFINP